MYRREEEPVWSGDDTSFDATIANLKAALVAADQARFAAEAQSRLAALEAEHASSNLR